LAGYVNELRFKLANVQAHLAEVQKRRAEWPTTYGQHLPAQLASEEPEEETDNQQERPA
jgi:hypothetical protein